MATAKAKKPTAKQLAARKLFAQRAKAGTLRKKAKAKPAAKRTSNPLRSVKTPRKTLVRGFRYQIDLRMEDGTWYPIAGFDSASNAKAWGQQYADDTKQTVRLFER